jgi:acid phosphatase family membrane protein YuiD
MRKNTYLRKDAGGPASVVNKVVGKVKAAIACFVILAEKLKGTRPVEVLLLLLRVEDIQLV